MIELIHLVVGHKRAEWQLGHPVWDAAIWVSIDDHQPIAHRMVVQAVICKFLVFPITRIDNARVDHLKTSWRLEIYVVRSECANQNLM